MGGARQVVSEVIVLKPSVRTFVVVMGRVICVYLTIGRCFILSFKNALVNKFSMNCLEK